MILMDTTLFDEISRPEKDAQENKAEGPLILIDD